MNPAQILAALTALAHDAHVAGDAPAGRLLTLREASAALAGQMGVAAETARKHIRAALATEGHDLLELVPNVEWRLDMPLRMPRPHLYAAHRDHPGGYTLVSSRQQAPHLHGPGPLTFVTTGEHLAMVCNAIADEQRRENEADLARMRSQAAQRWEEARAFDPELIGLLERLEALVPGLDVRAQKYSRKDALMINVGAHDAAQNDGLRAVLRAGLDAVAPQQNIERPGDWSGIL